MSADVRTDTLCDMHIQINKNCMQLSFTHVIFVYIYKQSAFIVFRYVVKTMGGCHAIYTEASNTLLMCKLTLFSVRILHLIDLFRKRHFTFILRWV